MAGMPGVIETVRFIRPGAKGFQGFIDYMDRDEAVRNEHFNEYSAFSPVNYDDSLTAVEKNQDSEFK
ncbi:relaxase MobL, partial [Latilactobacillus graminis]|uniref:relaxase MobL n=1 Tax=Latilactobacillus graminis TaxID=60519 RepID=UPI00070CD628